MKNGFRTIYTGKKLCIISHGHILNKIYQIVNSNIYFRENITLIDLFRCKPISESLSNELKHHFHTLVFDEQYDNFNLSTMLLKFVNKYSLNNYPIFFPSIHPRTQTCRMLLRCNDDLISRV